MDSKALEKYFENLRSNCVLENYVPRIFATGKDWDRISPLEITRRFETFRDSQPSLGSVLSRQNAVVLGDPGMGKSTIAKAAVNEILLAEQAESILVPIILEARTYGGNF